MQRAFFATADTRTHVVDARALQGLQAALGVGVEGVAPIDQLHWYSAG